MPIYRNKETGHEVEVMTGTRLPKVYEEVKQRKPKPSSNQGINAASTDVATKKPAAAKGTKGSKGKTATNAGSKDNATPVTDDTAKK